MTVESLLGVSPDVLLELMFGMGMVGYIWMLLLSVALSIPPILVLISKRSQGFAKFAWFMLASVFSWLGYIAFLLFTKPVGVKTADDDVSSPGSTGRGA
jgi:hypothetical protein